MKKAGKKTKEETNAAEYLVGIGSSAGGLEALQALLKNIKGDTSSIAFVIAQHVSPTYKSQLVELLSRQTEMPTSDAVDGVIPLGGNIYITPPDRDIAFADKTFLLTKPHSGHGPRPSVDHFFTSLAASFGPKSIGIVLSGTGSDGAQGVQAIKQAGGVVIVQDPETAKYNGMPASAIETRMADVIADPEKIGVKLVEWCHIGSAGMKGITHKTDDLPDGDALAQIMHLLSEHTGTDFSRYKPATIGRRLQKRLAMLGLESIEEYLEICHSKPDEIEALFTTILIGVTYFFRDEESFEALREQLSKRLSPGQEKVRIWIAGCASGEEAYSIAILVADILGDGFRGTDVQIFATDLDENALNRARKGQYPEASLDNVPDRLKEKFFIARKNSYEIVPAIRSMVLFSRHDVTNNPPFLKLDLISCRNLLIYFGQELQQHVLPLFHYALKPDGLLFLGKSETIGAFSDLFETQVNAHKIYARKGGGNPYAGRLMSFRPNVPSLGVRRQRTSQEYSLGDMVKDTLYHGFDHPYVVVNSSMEVLEVFGDTSGLLSIRPGVMNGNLVSLIDPRFELELRSLLTQAVKGNSATSGNLHRITDDGEYLRFSIKPVLYSGTKDALYIVIFERLQLEGALVTSSEGSETAATIREKELEAELRSTREHLQNYIEELETSTEELQSLNEELQSTNEEMQSSNEELETSNEELQSTNEELQIAYTELRTITDEMERSQERLEASEANLKAVLNNTLQAFVLLDRGYKIVIRNEIAKAFLEGISGQKMDEERLVIDYLPSEVIEPFHAAFARCLAGQPSGEERSIEHADGVVHWYQIQFNPVFGEDEMVQGVSFAMLDITDRKMIEIALDNQKQFNQLILNSAQIGICLTDIQGNIVQVNDGYCKLFGYNENELLGRPFTMLLPSGMREYAARLHTRFLAGETEESAGEWEVLRKDGATLYVMTSAGRLQRQDGSLYKVTTVIDITAQKQAEEERNRLFNVSLDLMCIMRYDGFFQHLNPSWINTMGYSYDRLSSQSLVEFVHPDDRKVTLDFLQSLIEKPDAPTTFENRCITADGSERWLSWNMVVVAPQRLIYAVARDVTDARRYETLLRDTQQVAKVGGWELDLGTNNTSWTDEVYRIYEIPPGTRTDYMQGLDAYEDTDKELIKAAIGRAAEYGESSDMEVRFTSAAGRKLWVRITFKGVGGEAGIQKVMGTIQDITKQKVAELENLRLSLVASRTDNGVLIADSTSRVEWVNHGFETITGYSLPVLRGLTLEKAFDKMGSEEKEVERIALAVKKKQSFQVELRLHKEDGVQCWLRLDITPVVTDSKQLSNWIVLMHDVTEQKKFQSELIEAKEKAEEMNRLKSSFLANMSHEIRTPLNGILGMSHLIQRDANDPEIKECANLLEQSGQRLLRTISQVLDLSKLESRQMDVRMERLEVNTVCQRICDSMVHLAHEASLELIWKPNPDPIFVQADEYLIENIVLNLLNNAIKFTPKGVVTVAVRSRSVDGRAIAVVEVHDTGIGMSSKYLDKLFEPFSQESTGQARKYEGTGLGLSISREYARLMDGDIEVSSRAGKGSTFRLLLKLAV